MEDFITQHPDVIRYLLYLCFSGFVFVCTMVLRNVNKNQTELFSRLHTLEQEFYHLKGVHDREMMMARGYTPKRKEDEQ